MRTVVLVLCCCALAWAQETARSGVVGVQARRNLSLRGRSMPVQARQVGVVVGAGLVLTATLGEDAEDVRVFLPGTTEALDAEIVESDAAFTVLRAPDLPLEPVEFDRAWQPRVGESVTWVGILAGAEGRWTPVRKAAHIDALLPDPAPGAGQAYSDPPFRGPVVVTCALILDAKGRAVGLMVPHSTDPAGRGGGRGGMMRRGAASLPVVRPAASFAQYLGGGIATRGVLGISGEPLGEQVARALGMEGTEGVLVTQVTPGSGAEEAGLEAQMVIVKVDGKATPTLAALQQALRGKPAGETVEVDVLKLADDGPVRKTVRVELTARDTPDKENRLRARRFGFQAEPITALVRRTYGLGEEVQGVHVRRVTRGSPASLARPTPLRRGDVILRVGDTDVKDIDALEKALAAIADGTSVSFFVRHGSETRFVEIKPEAPAER